MSGDKKTPREIQDLAAVAEEDRVRADFYEFLAGLLVRPADTAMLRRLSALSGDDTDIGRAIEALAAVARSMSTTTVRREFNDLFIGLGRGELVPYASFYMTGFLNEKPLARLRQDMARHAVARAEAVFEPEDNIASLCEIMSGLIRGRFGAPLPLPAQREFFATHLAPWAAHFFSDLEAARASVFYAPVGTLGRLMIEIEREAFRLGGGTDP
ncbi:molecular chaperone TorD family protein [Paroceanicella profunda]|uniref:Molecular chaperone TorD family protein n=1 Tax=Paroceanicella profunda TaxID=2579971 RepID=A0A5B8FUL3_9RHOB|nr:molecular chaperone TorD family protein [Paroceanicella profunda]QDL92436.1 molecular chaperone TorD family protein [Paroceanicella profunda]